MAIVQDETRSHDDAHTGDVDRLDWEAIHRPLFAADIVGARVAAPPFLFSGLLRSRTLTMISAEPFTGKTLLMLAFLLHLDTLTPFLGRFSPAQGHRSLFIGQDAPTWDYHGQFLKLFYGLPPSGGAPSAPSSMASEAFAGYDLPSIFFLNKGFSILDGDFVAMLAQAVALYGISVLFLDTLLEFHNLDENSNRDMKRVMGVLKHARDALDLTVFFSHHTRKPFVPAPQAAGNSLPGNGLQLPRIADARGASVIGGSVDAHIALRAAGVDVQGSPLVELSFPKGRGLDNAAPIIFSISPLSRSDNTPALALRAPSDVPTLIHLFLLPSPKSRSDIADYLDTNNHSVSSSTLSRILSSLEQKGLIHSPTHGQWTARERTTDGKDNA